MRPIKLTMTAFGTYAEKTVLEMDKLGKGGIYLITGVTGAGKTTIFDAITYALYGEASGGNRDADMLRSKYADPETPTEVELVFTYADKVYTVKRKPKYMAPKQRGEGTTERPAEAVLTYPDGRVVTRRDDVNKCIEQIMGITCAQFKQIAMIAQGDFQKLLFAPTQERKNIFSKIFGTGIYSVLQDNIKLQATDLGKKCAAKKSSLRQYISGIVTAQDEPLSVLVDKAKTEGLPFDDTVQLLEKLIAQDNETAEKNQNAQQQTAKQLETVNTALGKIEIREKTLAAIAADKNNLDKEKVLSEQLKKELDTQTAKVPETDDMAKQQATLEAELESYDALDELQKAVISAQKKLSGEKQKLDRTKQQHNVLKKCIEEDKAQLKGLSGAGENLIRLENEKEKAEQREKKLTDLAIVGRTLSSKKSEFEKLREEYTQAAAKSEACSAEYTAKSTAFFNEQAGIIAKQLSDGERCPVCGSTEHPHKASLSENAPSQDDVKRAEQARAAAEKAAAKKSEDCKAVRAEYDLLLDDFKKKVKDLWEEGKTGVSAAIKSELAEIKENKANLDAEIKAEQENIKSKNAFEKRIPENECELARLQQSLEEIEKTCAALGSEIASQTKQAEKLQGSLRFASKKDAQAQIELLRREITARKAALENAAKKHNDSQGRIKEFTASIKSLQEQLSQDSELDKDKLNEQKRELSQQSEELATLAKQIHSRLETNRAVLDNITAVSSELGSLEKRYSWVKALSDTANGSISGKEKITLEAYIQMTYFERIIARANTRFMMMTGGQFELVRRTQAENKQTQSGLDLDVIDHYIGAVRSVKTLSGGESFKASLSLALGLSDEIQSSAGGVKLETMFVDEGFGSLDSDSLEQAMNALNSLADSNRLIGIISHVDALKSRIDNQIVITKAPDGTSRAEIRLA